MMTFTDALAEVHRDCCLVDRHDDRCIALTAGVDGLVSQRDRARRIAVSLEQEIALLQDSLNQTGAALLAAVEA
jgi:hypothetical protein